MFSNFNISTKERNHIDLKISKSQKGIKVKYQGLNLEKSTMFNTFKISKKRRKEIITLGVKTS